MKNKKAAHSRHNGCRLWISLKEVVFGLKSSVFVLFLVTRYTSDTHTRGTGVEYIGDRNKNKLFFGYNYSYSIASSACFLCVLTLLIFAPISSAQQQNKSIQITINKIFNPSYSSCEEDYVIWEVKKDGNVVASGTCPEDYLNPLKVKRGSIAQNLKCSPQNLPASGGRYILQVSWCGIKSNEYSYEIGTKLTIQSAGVCGDAPSDSIEVLALTRKNHKGVDLLDYASRLVKEKQCLDLIVFPEYSCCDLSGNNEAILEKAKALAREAGVNIILATVPNTQVIDADGEKKLKCVFSSILVLDRSGNEVYSKLKTLGSDWCRKPDGISCDDDSAINSAARSLALSTSKPFTLTSRRGKNFNVFSSICADLFDRDLLCTNEGSNADILVWSTVMGPDYGRHETEHLKKSISEIIIPQYVNTGVIKPDGYFLVADAYASSITNLQFTPFEESEIDADGNYVYAKIKLPSEQAKNAQSGFNPCRPGYGDSTECSGTILDVPNDHFVLYEDYLFILKQITASSLRWLGTKINYIIGVKIQYFKDIPPGTGVPGTGGIIYELNLEPNKKVYLDDLGVELSLMDAVKKEDNSVRVCINKKEEGVSNEPAAEPNKFKVVFLKVRDPGYRIPDVGDIQPDIERLRSSWDSLVPCRMNEEWTIHPAVCDIGEQISKCIHGSNGNELLQILAGVEDLCISTLGLDDFTVVVALWPFQLGINTTDGPVPTVGGTATGKVVSRLNMLSIYGRDQLTDANLIHELGHFFGLCDEGYTSIIKDECLQETASNLCRCSDTLDDCSCLNGCSCCPNKPEEKSIMCSIDSCNHGCSPAVNFAPTSRAHLINVLKQNNYCFNDNE